MIITNWQFLFLFLSTYALVGLLTPLMRKVAISKQILDRPNSLHKSHVDPIPYLGGVAIILGIIVVTYSALFLYKPSKGNFWLATSIIGPALIMGLIGLWDDIKNLHPFPRFIGQTISGIIVAVILFLSDNFGTPTGSIKLDLLLTIFWIVGICNSINFFDNIDGGAAGTVAISSIALFFLAIGSKQSLIAALSFVVAGGTLGFLIWNRPPARIYMGDAGALFLGVLIATLSVRLKPQTDSILASFATPILLLAIPILDTTVALISRLRRKISPFQGGKDHLSHRLMRKGIPRKRVVILLWLMSGFFCTVASFLHSLSLKSEILTIILITIFWIFLFMYFSNQSDSE